MAASPPAASSIRRLTHGGFQAVIFDCDGVLVDSEVLVIEALTKVCAELGVTYDAGVHCTRFLGLEAAAIFENLERDFHRQHAKPMPASFRQDCFNHYRAAAEARLAEVPGARRAIGRLQLPIAVASSSDRRSLTWKLEKTGLLALFGAHVYSRETVARSKPAPDLYLHAAAALETQPERCLVLEDSENGICAARAAGMTAWGFRGGAHLRGVDPEGMARCGAERIVDDWEALARLLTAD